jgi:HK97 family phage prohead protease
MSTSTRATTRTRDVGGVAWRTVETGGVTFLEGHASVSESRTYIGPRGRGFWETVARGAFKDVLAGSPRVTLNLNHNDSDILATTMSGTLTLTEDSRGLHVRAQLPNTSLGNDVRTLIASGILGEMSFKFSIAEERELPEIDGSPHYRIERIGELYDVCVCPVGAYPQTSVELAARARRNGGESLDVLKARVARSLGRFPTVVREPDQYGPTARNSWFLDIAWLAQSEHNGRLARSLGEPARNFSPHHLDGVGMLPAAFSNWSPEAARVRVDEAARESMQARAIGTSSLFAPPAGPPVFVGSAFAVAMRAASVVAGLFRIEPMEDTVTDTLGRLAVSAPRFTSGVSVAVQVEQAAAVNTDPATGLLTSPAATIAGEATASAQLVELSGGPGGAASLDAAIAAELGAAWGERLDVQLLTGTAAGGQTMGLLSVPSATSASYTDATPSGPELISVLTGLASQTGTARGRLPDTAILHGRRWAWLSGQLDTANRPFSTPEGVEGDTTTAVVGGPVGTLPPSLAVFATNAMPTTLGGGTEDRIILICRQDMVAFLRGPVFKAADQTAIANLQYLFACYGYLGSLPNRWPGGVGVLAGTGLAAPIGY